MAVPISILELSRDAGGTVSVTTNGGHGFVAGDKVRFYNVMLGGSFPIASGNPYTVAAITPNAQYVTEQGTVYNPSNVFRVVQAGATAAFTAEQSVTISAGSYYQNSDQYAIITTSAPHNFTTQPTLKINGVTSPTVPLAKVNGDINKTYKAADIQVVSSTQFIVRLGSRWTQKPVFNWTAGTVKAWSTGMSVAYDDGINTLRAGIGGLQITPYINVRRGRTEGWIVSSVVNLVANSKGTDYAFLRLFDPRNASRISKTRNRLQTLTIESDAETLRSALDAVIEAYQGQDSKKRRYFIDQDGLLNYQIVDDAIPATATAPYKIITTGAGSPNLSNAAATLAPFALTVTYDHDTTKRALFRGANIGGNAINDLIKYDSPDALGTSYTRTGAAYFDEVVDYPSGAGDKIVTAQAAAKSFFLERHQPILSGQFTLRGAGTATWNNLGFTAGYALITPNLSQTTEITLAGTGAGYGAGTAVIATWPLDNGIRPGMSVVVANIPDTGFSGTFTVAGTGQSPYPYSFQYASASVTTALPFGYLKNDPTVTAYASFVRTGTAPSQIVTVTSPVEHGLSDGAVVTVTGLTGTAGTSMNTTATMTRIDNFSFTYPSTGTNGTATGPGTITAINLVPRWSPGQFVDITAAELGLSGLYRVEQVDWELEPGSFQQIVTVTFNRRPSKTLTKLLRE